MKEFRHRHYGDAVYVSAVIGVIAASWLVPAGSVIGAAATGVAIAVMATGIVLRVRHRKGPLCDECIKEMPLDAADEAQNKPRTHRQLALFHSAYGTGRRTQATGILTLLLTVAGCEPLYLAVGAQLPPEVPRTALSLALAACACSTLVMRTHNRFQPWCPFCRDDGRGGDDLEPAPDPQGGLGRPVPA
ncbi:hypothetical protein [Streptomyces sp. NBC_00239]|uniref:hypothetical protein n=1 Tax=Streptomyces sp. NBC_00239 TaxID=2903640 RepID=UPI002E2846D8|nr:hypothetical protein [Streptomyces sp. NBC_00239]